MVKIKTCIFISGRGSNLNNLIARTRDKSFPIEISLVISNKKNAFGINYAKNLIYLMYILILNIKIVKIK